MIAERLAGRLCLALLLGLLPFAMCPQQAVAQAHFNGLTAGVSCPEPLVCPSDTGTTVPCTVTVENRDPDHGLAGLVVQAGFRTPEPLSGCSPVLAASDGAEGAGPDFTSCTFNLEFTVDFCLALNTSILRVLAAGFDADPVPLPQGFGGLPAEGSVSTTLAIDVIPHSVRLATTLDCARAGTGPASCRLTVENEDVYHAATGIVFTKQAGFPKGPIRKIEPGCATSLGRGDGVAGSGPDFTSCTFQEPLERVCEEQSDGVQIQVVANGQEDVESGLASGGTATSGVVRTFSCGAGHLAALATEISCPGVVGESSTATCTISIENRDTDHDLRDLIVRREIPLPNGTRVEVEGCESGLRPSAFTSCSTHFSLRDVGLACDGPFVVVGIAAEASGKDGDGNPLDRGGCGGLDVTDRVSTSVLFLCGTP